MHLIDTVICFTKAFWEEYGKLNHGVHWLYSTNCYVGITHISLPTKMCFYVAYVLPYVQQIGPTLNNEIIAILWAEENSLINCVNDKCQGY